MTSERDEGERQVNGGQTLVAGPPTVFFLRKEPPASGSKSSFPSATFPSRGRKGEKGAAQAGGR